jgi:hypothetical protein
MKSDQFVTRCKRTLWALVNEEGSIVINDNFYLEGGGPIPFQMFHSRDAARCDRMSGEKVVKVTLSWEVEK